MTHPPIRPWSRRVSALLAALAAAALLAACGDGSESPSTTAASTLPAGTVTVWFPDDLGDLVRETRLRPAGADPLATALSELAAGPRGAGLLPGLPAGTRVLSARREGDVAVVDLSDSFATGYPAGGSTAEIATVGPVVLTAAGASGARAVRLLVEGEPPRIASAQLDLSEPLAPQDLGAP